jgi:mannose-6-phosphate isomerase-like protein (cupin superfamily)
MNKSLNIQPQKISDRFKEIDEYWSPKVIGEVNDQYVKIAKLKGEFVWHDHKEEDELFYIVKGKLDIHMKENIVHLEEGAIYVVPRGVQHKPVALNECWVMLLEKKTTKHTGDVITEFTRSIEEQLK